MVQVVYYPPQKGIIPEQRTAWMTEHELVLFPNARSWAKNDVSKKIVHALTELKTASGWYML